MANSQAVTVAAAPRILPSREMAASSRQATVAAMRTMAGRVPRRRSRRARRKVSLTVMVVVGIRLTR